MRSLNFFADEFFVISRGCLKASTVDLRCRFQVEARDRLGQ